MGISKWPYQGKDERMGFWLCADFFKNLSHLNTGAVGFWLPHLVNSATALGIWPEKNRFQLSWLQFVPTDHSLPAQYSTWPAPTSLQVFAHLSLSQGGILGMPYSKSPPDTSQNIIFIFLHSLYCQLTCHIFDVFILFLICVLHENTSSLGAGIFVFCSLWYPQCPEQYLAYSRCSIKICWMNCPFCPMTTPLRSHKNLPLPLAL